MFAKIRKFFSDEENPKPLDAYDAISDKEFLLKVIESNWDLARMIDTSKPNHMLTLSLTIERSFTTEAAKELLAEIVEEISNVN